MAHVQAAGAMRTVVGVNTGVKGPSADRKFALGEVSLDSQGNAWIYCQNTSGSTISAGQVAASYAGALTTGTGAVIDKDVAHTEYYWARLLDAGVGPAQDLVPTITFAAGAANVCTVTITWKDKAGNTVKGVRTFDVYLSGAATGAGIATTGVSGELVATTGTSLTTVTTHKRWTVQSAATGIFVGSLTDTEKSVGLYICVNDPQAGVPVVAAAATAAGSYG